MGTLWNVDGTTGQIKIEDGTVSALALTFISDPNTGIYHVGTDDLALATNGTQALEINSTQQIVVPKTSNQIILGTTNTVTLSFSAPVTSRTLTIPAPTGNRNFLLSGEAQIVTGDINASANIVLSQLASITDGHIIVGAVTTGTPTSVTMSSEASIINTGAVTLSNAAVIGKVLTGFTSGSGSVTSSDSILAAIQHLDGNVGTKLNLSGGTLTGSVLPSSSSCNLGSGTQEWGLVYSGGYIVGNPTTPGYLQLWSGGLKYIDIWAVTPSVNSNYTIRDVGANADFVMTEGTQTLNGSKTFSSDLTIFGNKALIINDGEGTPKTVTIKTPATLTASYNMILPVNHGAAGEYLKDAAGDGILSWDSPTGSGTVNSGTQYQLAYYTTTGTTVDGNSSITTNASNQLLVPAGLVTAPSLTFTGDPNTGIFSSGVDQIGFSCGGVIKAVLSSTDLDVKGRFYAADGTVALPAYSFNSDPDTGIYRSGANELTLVTGGGSATGNTVFTLYGSGGTEVYQDANTSTFLRVYNGNVGSRTATTSVMSLTNRSTSMDGSIALVKYALGHSGTYSNGSPTSNSGAITISSDQIARWAWEMGTSGNEGIYYNSQTYGGVARLTNTGRWLVSDGTATDPSLSFLNDLGTGMYSGGVTNLRFATVGVGRWQINSTGDFGIVTGNAGVISTSDGTAAGPSYSFLSDTDTGIYKANTNVLGFSAGSTGAQMFLTNTTLQLNSPLVAIRNVVGSVTVPSYSFDVSPTDNGTGIYWVSAGKIGITLAGTKYVDLSTTAVTISAPLIAKGTITNDSAAASYIGEYIESVVGPVNPTASETWYNMASISLTAGDWDVSLMEDFSSGATNTAYYAGISADATPSSFSDSVIGSNYAYSGVASSLPMTMSIPVFRVSLAAADVYYAKSMITYTTLGGANSRGRLSARRVR